MNQLIKKYITGDRRKARAGDQCYMVLPNGKLRELGRIDDPRNSMFTAIGAPGSGKTNGLMRPTLAVSNASMVVLDQKARLYQEFRDDLEERGFRVQLLNFQNPEQSVRFNPLVHVDSTADVMKVTDMIVNLTGDPYSQGSWDEAEKILLNAVLGALAEGIKGFMKTPADMSRLLRMIDARDLEEYEKARIYKLYKEHDAEYRKRTGQRSWGFDQLRKLTGIPGSQVSGILLQAQAALSSMDSRELRRLTAFNDIDMHRIGEEKTAIFVQTSDSDRSKDLLINLFFCILMNELCDDADSRPDGRLPRPVLFLLDDFCTTAKIYNFPNMLSNMRARNISALLAVQAISQLEAYYGREWTTIINDCDTVAYLGGCDPDTAYYFSKMFNMPPESITDLGLKEHILKLRGEKTQRFPTSFFTDAALAPAVSAEKTTY